MENKEKNRELISDLNELVEINNDRVEGYKTAMKETEHADLKDLFKEMAEHSFEFKNELSDEVLRMGGELETGTRTTGKFYRAWMDFKAALTGKNIKAILSSCEYGEDVALETYDSILKKASLAPTVKYMINKQREQLKQDHDKIKALRDTGERAAR